MQDDKKNKTLAELAELANAEINELFYGDDQKSLKLQLSSAKQAPNELSGCPFCNAPPSSSREPGYVWRVGCRGLDCRVVCYVTVTIKDINDAESVRAAQAEAEGIWNAGRADLAPPEQAPEVAEYTVVPKGDGSVFLKYPDGSHRGIYIAEAAFINRALKLAASHPTVPPSGDKKKASPTDELVDRFAVALKDKLNHAREKYGYHAEQWSDPKFINGMRESLYEHLAKGDPRDVAAFAAFLWHHGETTAQNTGKDMKLRSNLEYLRGWQAKDGAAVVVEVAEECLALLGGKEG